MAGFLTAQAPVNALKPADHLALAQAAAARNVAAQNGNLTALKKVCTPTSKLRKLTYAALTTAGIAGVYAIAYSYGFTPDYLMSLIDPTGVCPAVYDVCPAIYFNMAHEYVRNILTIEPPITCPEGFMNVANKCVEMLPTDMPTVLVNCQEGFMNVANTCVEACKGMPSILNGVVGVMTNGVYNAATATCSYTWDPVNFVANNPLTCAEGFIENTGTCVEVAKPVVETVTETFAKNIMAGVSKIL